MHPCLTNWIWLRLRNLIKLKKTETQEKKPLQRKQLDRKRWRRRSKQADPSEVCIASMHCIFHKHCFYFPSSSCLTLPDAQRLGQVWITVLPIFITESWITYSGGHVSLFHLPALLAGKENNLHIKGRCWLGRQWLGPSWPKVSCRLESTVSSRVPFLLFKWF